MSTGKTYIAEVTSQATSTGDFQADDFKTLVSQIETKTGTRKAQMNFAVGFASAPVENDRLIVTEIGNALYALGGDTQKIIESLGLVSGERCIYSTDDAGAIKQKLVFGTDGVMTLDGGSDYAVRFLELEKQFAKFVSDYNNSITAEIAHTHLSAAPGSASGVPVYVPTPPSQTAADLKDAKVSTFKLPTKSEE